VVFHSTLKCLLFPVENKDLSLFHNRQFEKLRKAFNISEEAYHSIFNRAKEDSKHLISELEERFHHLEKNQVYHPSAFEVVYLI